MKTGLLQLLGGSEISHSAKGAIFASMQPWLCQRYGMGADKPGLLWNLLGLGRLHLSQSVAFLGLFPSTECSLESGQPVEFLGARTMVQTLLCPKS